MGISRRDYARKRLEEITREKVSRGRKFFSRPRIVPEKVTKEFDYRSFEAWRLGIRKEAREVEDVIVLGDVDKGVRLLRAFEAGSHLPKQRATRKK